MKITFDGFVTFNNNEKTLRPLRFQTEKKIIFLLQFKWLPNALKKYILPPKNVPFNYNKLPP